MPSEALAPWAEFSQPCEAADHIAPTPQSCHATTAADRPRSHRGKWWEVLAPGIYEVRGHPNPPDMVGRISPRAFFPVQLYSVPEPTHFKETINNSFSDHAQQTMFLLRWYQFLFGHRHQMKTPSLLVYGVKDCGKPIRFWRLVHA